MKEFENRYRQLVLFIAVMAATMMAALLLSNQQSGVPSGSAPKYELQDLGAIGGQNSQATGINNAGQVVGVANNSEGALRAFLFGAQMRDLGTLPHGRQSAGVALNNRGQVVGYGETMSTSHAFYYDGSTMRDLGTLGGGVSAAFAVNDAGQAVGASQCGDGTVHACVWHDGQVTDLGALGGASSIAYGINSHGVIVGRYNAANGGVGAFIVRSGEMTRLTTQPAIAVAVADNDSVTGAMAMGSRSVDAFLYTDGRARDIGTLGGPMSVGLALNAAGDVVGYSTMKKSEDAPHAFLFRDHKIYDLNDLVTNRRGWLLFEATGVNEAGQIAATAFDGKCIHAVRLLPAG